MSREIKFRAWDKSIKQMLPNVQNHIHDPDWAFGRMLNNPDRFDVMQFTGLKDKNGIDIYEGDIIKYSPDEDVSVVVFKGSRFCLDYSSQCLSTLKGIRISLEVVGNIHQNPELL